MTAEEKNTKRLPRLSPVQQRIALIVIGVLVILLAVFWLIRQVYQTNLQRIDTSKYQIIRLVNGQVYFGKLQNTSGEYLVMNAPHVAQSVKDTATNAEETTALVRVKDQVYGPEDSIAIRADQVVFWQNLRDDSKVTQAIKSKE